MWPDIIKKSKEGGLNVIQTYVFWNGHEPQYGKVKLALNDATGWTYDSPIYMKWFGRAMWLPATVQLWREIRLGQVHQAGAEARDVRDPSARSLHSSGMEPWVCIDDLSFLVSTTPNGSDPISLMIFSDLSQRVAVLAQGGRQHHLPDGQ